jgi:methyltransferase (TIGR00027 family)
MDDERPSQTAEGALTMRALHQMLDDDPKILDDPIALQLIDPEGDVYKSRLEMLGRLPLSLRLGFRSGFVMRNRYAEDCLAESFRNGVRQYVFLGAGFDTFAYRQPSWADSLQVFEVDHPATQRWKLKRLAARGLSVPVNVSIVPIDFEKISLADGLSAAGLNLTAPTFFSALGVTQYLNEEALDLTLKFILSMPRTSEIVFSFVLPDHALPADEANLAAAFVARFAALGEPWLTRFDPAQLAAKLTAIGFSRVLHLSPNDANQLYFRDRRDGLSAGTMEQMMRAIV